MRIMDKLSKLGQKSKTDSLVRAGCPHSHTLPHSHTEAMLMPQFLHESWTAGLLRPIRACVGACVGTAGSCAPASCLCWHDIRCAPGVVHAQLQKGIVRGRSCACTG